MGLVQANGALGEVLVDVKTEELLGISKILYVEGLSEEVNELLEES